MRGINIVAIGAGPSHALYFCSYEVMKKMLGDKGNTHLTNGIYIFFFTFGLDKLLFFVAIRCYLGQKIIPYFNDIRFSILNYIF